MRLIYEVDRGFWATQLMRSVLIKFSRVIFDRNVEENLRVPFSLAFQNFCKPGRSLVNPRYNRPCSLIQLMTNPAEKLASVEISSSRLERPMDEWVAIVFKLEAF